MSGASVLRAGLLPLPALGLGLGLVRDTVVGAAEAGCDGEAAVAEAGAVASVAWAVQPMTEVIASTAVIARHIRVFLRCTVSP
jgi:hypothetical protein